MNNYVQPGDVLTFTAPAGLSSGDAVKIGQLLVVAQGDALITEEFEGKVTGVFSLPKNAAEALTEGALVYWDGSEITTTPNTNLLVGVAVSDELAATTPVNIRLDGVARPDEPV